LVETSLGTISATVDLELRLLGLADAAQGSL
jgi:hypothetical protein